MCQKSGIFKTCFYRLLFSALLLLLEKTREKTKYSTVYEAPQSELSTIVPSLFLFLLLSHTAFLSCFTLPSLCMSLCPLHTQ